jgi:hypothetical protein
MRQFMIFALCLAVVGLVMAPAAFGHCGACGTDKHEAKAAVAKGEEGCGQHAGHDHAEHASKECCKGAHCDKCAKHAAVAASAKGGCEKSAAKLIAMAKDSGCEKSAALAAKADQGDEEALAQLATMCAGKSGHHGAESAMLASNAKGGCTKSAAKLIAMAKKSGCEKSAALAAKAEKGDKDAEAELIAMFVEEDPSN